MNGINASSTSSQLDFQLVNAFTSDTFGGNPAAIVFLKDEMPSNRVLGKIKDNFNQPIVVFISPPKSDTPKKESVAVFGIRWYGPWDEVPICGHGTLAATEAIFRRLDPADKITTLEFQSLSGLLTAHREPDNKITMSFPAGTTIPASKEETQGVEAIFGRAVGKDSVAINYVGHGGPGFKNYMLVEVDASEELSTWRPDPQQFAALERVHILVVTSASRQDGIAYETRMFAPNIGNPEDHVCGSANCLNAPYWAGKRGYPSGYEQHAKAVSIRGGEIWSTYFEGVGGEPGRVQMRGHVKHTASGTLDLADVDLN
ncbi:hypothetical protein FB451DRAFT_1085706 [Mycena latifolia]|nr:hypothetical protein FB451DRAFT_1085706 [Mycena latifolia]